MSSYRAWAKVAFYCNLPDDEAKADDEFQRITDHIADVLNEVGDNAVVSGSFSVDDADTEVDE